MVSESVLKELSNSITRVFDANNIEILFTKCEIKPYISKYSSSHLETPTLFLDDKPIYNRKKVRVEYKCQCGSINNILLCKFLLKNRLRCKHCSEDEEKIKWHKLYFEKKRNGDVRGWKIRKKRVYDFESETETFKENYFKSNLTIEEFESIKKYIYSIQNIVIYDKKLEFIVAYPGVNCKKYRQMVKINDVIYPFKDIKLQCALCGKIFHITRMIKERVKSHNFDCKKCYLNNKTFKVVKLNNNLSFQGNEEFNFIKRCNENQIEIVNGVTIPYTFKDEIHFYTVDFLLPNYGILVEIKDDHIWHRKQVESGKWAEKEKAAIEFCKQKGWNFKLLFPKDIDNFFKSIERDSLNSVRKAEKLE